MLYRLSVSVILLFVLESVFISGATYAANSTPKHVLILNSYHHGYKGSDDLVLGIEKSLLDSKISLDVKVEYLDSKYYSGEAHDQWVVEILKRKYAQSHYEVLIATDDYAFDVVDKHRDSIFGKSPVVFAGANYFDSARIKNRPGFTGVDESPSFSETIDLILRLHPATDHIVAIHDNRLTGQRNAQAFHEAAKPFTQRVKISSLSGLSMDELRSAVKAFNPGTIAIYFASQVDGGAEGVVLSSAALKRLAEITPVPLYGGWEFSLGHGIVGGKLINLYEHGILAGKLAAKVITGERLQTDQQVSPSPNRYMFDYDQLVRFGIPISALPADSVIINQPPSIFRTYAYQLIATLCLLLLASIGVSIRSLILRRKEFQIQAANLRAALDAAPVPMAINDAQQNVIYLNEAFIKAYGYLLTDIPRLDAWWDKAYPDPAYRDWVSREWATRVERSLQTGQPFVAMEVSLCTKDGSSRTVLANCAPVQTSTNGEAVVTLYDITERKQAEARLQQSEARFRQMFESNDAVMLLIDPNSGAIADANPAAAKFYGYEVERLKAMRIEQINTLAPDEIAERRAHAALHETNYFVFPHRLASGDVRTVEVRSSPINVGNRVLLFSIINDITERIQMEEQVHKLAFYDPLTKLPNRRLLYDRLKQAMAASKRSSCYGALMFLDLDNFKPLNDKHGHEIGDLLLIEAANRLSNCVREIDTVGRFGGDEFVVLLSELNANKDTSMKQVTVVAGKISKALSEPYILIVRRDGKPNIDIEHHCTASIGVVLFIDHEASQDDILKWADSAMYQAKEAGRNLIRFHNENG